ncbi:hypothetical protein [Brevifollis gellanilyticus]|uniref:Uncharacterized protein n=1 Tax=Brevifollis gellanilyticus TaxID=748831 RepID=A0A512M2L3_9BACT|nr:hypothetical protein [Brevifollis gellanilyticus]GEP40979.1 hypothetical protein BGE01nite_02700 [Brevifollis gellanilyticus]
MTSGALFADISGWGFVFLCLLSGRWGWLVALLWGLIVWQLRHSRHLAAAWAMLIFLPRGMFSAIMSTIYLMFVVGSSR